MAMPDYLPKHDQIMATRLVAECLRRGYSLSVYDGEETTVRKSTDREQVLDALGSTSDDHLTAWNQTGDCVGKFWLIWGNSEGDTIADYSANDECETLFEHAIKPFN